MWEPSRNNTNSLRMNNRPCTKSSKERPSTPIYRMLCHLHHHNSRLHLSCHSTHQGLALLACIRQTTMLDSLALSTRMAAHWTRTSCLDLEGLQTLLQEDLCLHHLNRQQHKATIVAITGLQGSHRLRLLQTTLCFLIDIIRQDETAWTVKTRCRRLPLISTANDSRPSSNCSPTSTSIAARILLLLRTTTTSLWIHRDTSDQGVCIISE